MNSVLEGTKVLVNGLIVPGVFFGENSLGLGRERKCYASKSQSKKLFVDLECLHVNIFVD